MKGPMASTDDMTTKCLFRAGEEEMSASLPVEDKSQNEAGKNLNSEINDHALEHSVPISQLANISLDVHTGDISTDEENNSDTDDSETKEMKVTAEKIVNHNWEDGFQTLTIVSQNLKNLEKNQQKIESKFFKPVQVRQFFCYCLL
jgi:hypothetical protein